MDFKRFFFTLGLGLCLLQSASAQAADPSPALSAISATAAQPPVDSIAHEAPAPAPKAGGPQVTFNSVYVDGSYIAMTFDDGPSATLTPKLLDLLAAHHMKATFFVVGQNAADHPEILKRAVREGHEIANHSWSHPNLGKMSDESVRRELQKTDDAIKAAIGTRPTLMRPPYGSITARQKNWIHDEFGYRIIIWDVDPLDWKRPGPHTVTHRILSEVRPGSIILAHDIHAPTIEAMPGTFYGFEAKGFKSVTVSELLAMARPKPVATPAPVKRAPAEKNPAPAVSTP